MIIAITLASLIWVWFQLGLGMAMALAATISVALMCHPAYRVSALVTFLLGAVVISSLEAQMRYPLHSDYQHQTFPLFLCIEQVPRQYSDGTQSARARVVEQPRELSLRTIRFWLYPQTIEQSLMAGDCLQAEVRLRQPLGRLIPGTFNADRYNYAERIDAYGTVQSVTQIHHQPDLQQRIYLNTQAKLGPGVGLDVWAALALGWSRAMSPDLKTVLAENQLMHLFVISGMHLAFVVAIISVLLNGVAWMMSPWAQVSRPRRFLLTGALTLSYVAFLGFPLPVTRAFLMLCLPMLRNLLAVQTGRLTILGWSAAVLMVWHPAAWLSPGPWLSFVSVAIILMIFEWQLLHGVSRRWQPFAFQGLMTLSILPWALVSGFSLNLLSVLTCLVLTGVIGFLGLPIAALLSFVDQSWLYSGWNKAVTVLIHLLAITADQGVELPYVGVWVLLPGVLILIWAIWHRGLIGILPASSLGVIVLCCFVFSRLTPVSNSLTVYDVGHGQAILLQAGGESVLYDTGGWFSPERSLTEAVLNRVLPPLDAAVISHSDTDHAAGTGFLRETSPRLPMWSGQPDLLPAHQTLQFCDPSVQINPLLTLIPIPDALRQRHDNNHSCVLIIEMAGHRVLLTGDADKFIEYYLLQTYPELFPFDVVILGHHGSDSSSARAFLSANESALFLVSSGDRLAPRWPSARIERWFSEQNKTLLNTARKGTIKIEFEVGQLTLKTWDSAYRNRLIN